MTTAPSTAPKPNRVGVGCLTASLLVSPIWVILAVGLLTSWRIGMLAGLAWGPLALLFAVAAARSGVPDVQR